MTGGATGDDGFGGIGSAICKALANTGVTVAVTDINEKGAQTTANTLTGTGHKAFKLDVTDRESSRSVFTNVEQTMGPVSILVTAAGFMEREMFCRLEDISMKEWDKTYEVNVKGTLHLLQAYMGARRKKAVEEGRIIMISSISSHRNTGRADYNASKAAINSMVHVAAKEAAEYGVSVNGIAPGAIDTPLFHSVHNPAKRQAIASMVPLGRLGVPNDIAGIVAFLASEAGAYISGTILDVDGGISAR